MQCCRCLEWRIGKKIKERGMRNGGLGMKGTEEEIMYG